MQTALSHSMKQVPPMTKSMQQWNYMTRQPGLAEPYILRQEDQQYTFSQSGSAERYQQQDFVERNRQVARDARGRHRHSAHLGRLRMLKQLRPRDSLLQARLLENASKAELMHN